MNIKNLNGMRTRDVSWTNAERDASSESDGRTLDGYAAVFNEPTEINSWEGRFIETIAPGAFKKTLSNGKFPAMQWNHGKDSRVGAVPIGVYTDIAEDAHGLRVSGRLFDNQVVEPVRQAIEAGAVTGMSFSFRVIRDEWRDNQGELVKGDEIYRLLYQPGDRGPLKRTLREVQLSEAGPVLNPAYDATSVGVRSADDLTEEEREALAAEYRRSMLGDSAEERFKSADEASDIAAWLREEALYNLEVKRWLEAEKEHRDISLNLNLNILVDDDDDMDEDEAAQAISTDSDADPMRDTSGGRSDETPPEDNAAQTSTLRRDSTKETEERKAPKNVRKSVMTLAELKERLAVIDVRQAELAEEFRDAEMPEAEEREYKALPEERATIEARIAKIEARMKELQDSGSRERGFSGAPAFRKSDDIYNVVEIRNSAYSEDDYRVRMVDNAKRAVEKASFGGGSLLKTEDPAKNVEALLTGVRDDEQTKLAERILRTGSPLYERAWGKAIAAGSPQILDNEEFRSLSLGTDANGGFAVPFQLDPTVILTSAGVINPLRQISRVERIVGKQWNGITSAGTTVSRQAEAAEANDNSFTLTSPSVRTNRVTGFIPFSYELAESWGSVKSEITRALVDAKAREEATSFLLGDGTGVNANGLVTTLSGNTVNTNAVGAFAVADVYNLEQSLDPRYRTSEAKWLANHTWYNAVRQFDTTNGNALWVRIGGGQPGTLMNYEALEASAMPSVVSTGNKIAVFGNFENFLIVDRIGMQVELIPQIFGSNQRPTGQRGIYAIWMNNSKILVDAAFKVLVVK